MKGFAHEEFKTMMDDLKDKKAKLEVAIKEQENRSKAPKITEEQVKQLLSIFRDFVIQKNILECKKFIQNYVDKDRVEIIFNVVFNILQDYETYKIRYSVNKDTLFKRYSNIA